MVRPIEGCGDSDVVAWGFPPFQLAVEAVSFLFLARLLHVAIPRRPLDLSAAPIGSRGGVWLAWVLGCMAFVATALEILDEAIDGSPWFVLTACSTVCALLCAVQLVRAVSIHTGALAGPLTDVQVRGIIASMGPVLAIFTFPYIVGAWEGVLATGNFVSMAGLEALAETLIHACLMLALFAAPRLSPEPSVALIEVLGTLADAFDVVAFACSTWLVMISAVSGLNVGFVVLLPSGTGLLAKLGVFAKYWAVALFIAAIPVRMALAWVEEQFSAWLERVLAEHAPVA
uniref:Uncharacterized protein n=2 Tax=Cafeteria roenbergensis TaxID=33653 RepID=A0A7S0JPC7_CAFRO